jgi:D-3-phosphoglycerate dehydrogenase / 2-oxoglutarate reductase
MRTIGVIPARGGSKGIPRKNLVALLGKPILAYTIEAAKSSKLLTDLVVSTDDEEIAAVAAHWGAHVPFMRPAELATDAALSLPVVQHAVLEMEKLKDHTYDVAVMLQPTTPLRSTEDIDAGIQLLLDTGADSVISVVEVSGHHPFRMKRLVRDNVLINYIDQGFEDMRPRQQLPSVYIRSGALYVVRRSTLVEQDSFVGADCRAYVMPEERTVNIDTRLDLLLAEHLLREKMLQR